MTKSPIDIKRDSGGMVNIGTPEDGAVGKMVEIDGSLYIIKEKSIYALQTADQIDPDRTNIALPNVIPRPVLTEGFDCELVGKTLLTAATLFNKGKFLPTTFEHGRALSLSFEVLKNMIAMRTEAEEFEAAQRKACERTASASSAGSPHFPSMGDVTNPCRAFMQQAFHAQGSLLAIVRLFYCDIEKAPWDILFERVKGHYGESDDFTQFLVHAVPFLKGVMNIRDCLDHKNIKGVTIKDFAMQLNGKISVPTIEVDFRGTRQPPVTISEFMTYVLTNLMIAFELMIVYLCGKHYEAPAPFPIHIGMPSENRRHWKHVRFYYGSVWDGEFIPMG